MGWEISRLSLSLAAEVAKVTVDCSRRKEVKLKDEGKNDERLGLAYLEMRHGAHENTKETSKI